AIVTFPKKGIYPVTLNVTVKSTGAKLTDTENIEVRKTPYVEGGLGGFQKQNRKQTLDFRIATYPDKPITDWCITIKDEKTGELARITADNPKFVGTSIKTREAKVVIEDKYWTKISVEFLTKYPKYSQTGEASRDFYYDIKVTDSKGDSDSESGTFKVVPDLPPNPQIYIPSTFLREMGTDTAAIEAEDVSTTDGDRLERTWTVDFLNPLDNSSSGTFVNAVMLDGYKNMAFGTNQKIGFNKTGVGAFDLKLHLKDVWSEPTLEEYITVDDYLTAETVERSSVVNIAPVVSIEPISFKKANIFLLGERNSISEIKKNINDMTVDFIESGIDARISGVQIFDENENYEKGYEYAWSVADLCPLCKAVYGGSRDYFSDSTYAYIIESNQMELVPNVYEKCVGAHTVRAFGVDGEAWNYTVTESNSYSICSDSQEKYVYIRCSDINKTLVFNHKTGAYITTLDVCLPTNTPYMSPDEKRLYFYDGKTIKKFDFETLALSTVLSNEPGSLARLQEGKIVFIEKISTYQFCIKEFDMSTETIMQKNLPELPVLSAQDYFKVINYGAPSPVDMDSKGNVVFVSRSSYGGDYRNIYATFLWVASHNSNKAIGKVISTYRDYAGYDVYGFVKNEIGEAKYLYEITINTSGGTRNLKVYDFSESNLLGDSHGIMSDSQGSGDVKVSTSQMSYAVYDDKEKKIYLQQPASSQQYYNGSGGGWGKGIQCVTNTEDWATTNGTGSFGSWIPHWFFEKTNVNGSLACNFYDVAYFRGSYANLVVSKIQKDKDEAISESVFQKINFSTDSDIPNFLVTSSSGADLQKTESLLDGKRVEVIVSDFSEDLVETIKDALKKPYEMIRLRGDSGENAAGLVKEMDLEQAEYKYRYNLYNEKGVFKDIFSIKSSEKTLSEGEKPLYVKEVQECNFVGGETNSFFTKITRGISFSLTEEAFVEFDYSFPTGSANVNFSGSGVNTLQVDGQVIRIGFGAQTSNLITGKKMLFLQPGDHTITTGSGGSGQGGIINIKVTYLTDQPQSYSDSSYTKNDLLYEVQGITKNSGVEYYITEFAEKRMQKAPDDMFERQSSFANSIYDYISVTFTAPEDKVLLVRFNVTTPCWTKNNYNRNDRYTGTSTNPSGVVPGVNTAIIKPGQSLKVRVQKGVSKTASISIDNIYYALIDKSEIGGTTGYNMYTSTGEAEYGGGNYLLFDTSEVISNPSGGTVKIIKYVKENANSKSKLQFLVGELKDAMVSDFSLYKKINGKWEEVMSNAFNSLNALLKEGWDIVTEGSGSVEEDSISLEKKAEEPNLIYSKGELVKYGVNYSDYENDPSKASRGYSYWVYAHEPFNDGEHSQAAIIYDEDGNIIKICGKTVEEALSDVGIELESAESLSMDKAIEA
ncbi:MAG: hypothetical protein ACI4LO_02820, partial [Anaerovoracaceae bacterium]